MKAVIAHEFGGPEVLIYEDSPEPSPSKGQVLIEVHGSSINPVDKMSISKNSSFKNMIKLPLTPGVDVSGVIIDVGSDVKDLKVGDKVYGQAGALQKGTGAFAEFAVAPINVLARMPENISFKEAAALPLASVSAYQALVQHMNLQKGQKILIQGGSGGIGSFAIQLARYLGAYVATTSTGPGMEYARKQGAHEVIDYMHQSFENILQDFDAVLDTVGGDTYKKSFKVLKKDGMIVSMLEAPDEELMKKYGVRAVQQLTAVNKESLDKVSALIKKNVFKVNIAKTFPLKDTKEAFKAKEDEMILGKIAIEVRD